MSELECPAFESNGFCPKTGQKCPPTKINCIIFLEDIKEKEEMAMLTHIEREESPGYCVPCGLTNSPHASCCGECHQKLYMIPD